MRRTFVVVLLSAVALATYVNALQTPFVWDDDNAIATNESIRHVTTSLVPALETPLSGRPVVSLSFALNYAAGGLDTTGYHMVNLAIHVANALLLFGIVRRTLRRRGDESTPADGIALAAALVWMVHPLVSETIDYTTQRTESLMGLFFLLTLYASIRAWPWIAILSCAAGMATKESMVIAPIAVVFYDLVFEFDSVAEALAARRVLYAGLALTWVELGLLLWRFPKSMAGGTAVSSLTYALNQAQMIGRYLWLSIWPSALVVDYGVPQSLHAADVAVQLVIIAALVALTVFALFRWPAL